MEAAFLGCFHSSFHHYHLHIQLDTTYICPPFALVRTYVYTIEALTRGNPITPLKDCGGEC